MGEGTKGRGSRMTLLRWMFGQCLRKEEYKRREEHTDAAGTMCLLFFVVIQTRTSLDIVNIRNKKE